MNNISLRKEQIQLKLGVKYIVIDGLYINDIKSELDKLDINNLENDIREKIFIYTKTPFAEYTAESPFFNINKLKSIKDDKLENGNKGKLMLSTDTGLLIFINKNFFFDFIKIFDYDDLVDSLIEPINISYWEFITKQFELADIGLILSPGINSNIDFIGSGTYLIV